MLPHKNRIIVISLIFIVSFEFIKFYEFTYQKISDITEIRQLLTFIYNGAEEKVENGRGTIKTDMICGQHRAKERCSTLERRCLVCVCVSDST